jgi:AraC-like DNA-binding protein
MSESHFMSFFKQVTGLSFMKYLNHYRVERAQALLTNTDESMADISQEVGFCDQSYFGTVFRKIVGTTPAAYRRRLGTSGLHNSTHAPVPPHLSEGHPVFSLANIRKYA